MHARRLLRVYTKYMHLSSVSLRMETHNTLSSKNVNKHKRVVTNDLWPTRVGEHDHGSLYVCSSAAHHHSTETSLVRKQILVRELNRASRVEFKGAMRKSIVSFNNPPAADAYLMRFWLRAYVLLCAWPSHTRECGQISAPTTYNRHRGQRAR